MEEDLFATRPAAKVSIGYIDGQVPYLTVDGILADPAAVRAAALALPFSPAPAHYPGRLARFPAGDPSLTGFLHSVAGLVTRDYLPRLPAMPGGARLPALRGIDSDFAITDTHPSELRAQQRETEVNEVQIFGQCAQDQGRRGQREPHVDAVPIFGLLYLNEEPRGGTLFFKPRASSGTPGAESGYPSPAHERFEVCGRIEGLYNRLAIYPGFVLHSGEIAGEWIGSDIRFRSPRLTQRIMFFF